MYCLMQKNETDASRPSTRASTRSSRPNTRGSLNSAGSMGSVSSVRSNKPNDSDLLSSDEEEDDELFEEVSLLLEDGNRIRTMAATAKNATSSRSHAICQLHITRRTNNGKATIIKRSKINIVGNSDATTQVTNVLADTIKARYVRLNVKACNRYPSLKMSVSIETKSYSYKPNQKIW